MKQIDLKDENKMCQCGHIKLFHYMKFKKLQTMDIQNFPILLDVLIKKSGIDMPRIIFANITIPNAFTKDP